MSIYPIVTGLFVQTGFALLTCGLVRKKNAAHLVMLSLSAYVFSLLAYYAIGFGLQSGLHGFFFRGIAENSRPILDVAFMLVAGYILVGAVCERITFRAFVLSELFVGGMLYPTVAHFAWSGGWLARHGFVDFAGSSVVHSLGGFSAMALAMVLGPRLGKYGRDGQPRPFLAHNIVFVAVGTFVVLGAWVGLMEASLASPASAETLLINTNLAAAGGATAAMVFWSVSYGKPDISMACNGLLAGVVAISASAPHVGPTSALLIGAVAGLIACGGVLFNERTLRIDDPCGSVSVHGYCGWWGSVAMGIAVLVQGDISRFVIQVAGATGCAVFAFGFTYIVFMLVNANRRMRVDADVEAEGLDLNEFGMLAYPDEEGV